MVGCSQELTQDAQWDRLFVSNEVFMDLLKHLWDTHSEDDHRRP
jgi:hypothetical protein